MKNGTRYKPYPHYKDSGVEWLGLVPESWPVKAIKRETPIWRGASPRPIDDPIFFDPEGAYAWVRISDVTAAGKYLRRTVERLSELGSSLSVKLEPGSLFLSIAGSVGKPCITEIKCCIHDGFVYFPRWKEDVRFLFHVFDSGEPYRGLGKLGTQLNLNTETVGLIRIALPRLQEQRVITEFLDRETAKIDELIAKKERLIELLEETRVALITHAVTRGIHPDAPLRDSGIDWLGQIPKHWEARRLRFISRIQTGSKNTEDATDNGEYPFFVRAQTVERIGSYTFDCEAVLTAGDGVGVGKVFHHYIGKFDVHQRVYAITDFRDVSGRFLYLYMKELFYRVALGGEAKSTVDSLRRHNFTDFTVVLPPTREQNAIINYCDTATKHAEAVAATIRTAIDRLREYRRALITAAVTGKIDVRDQVASAA